MPENGLGGPATEAREGCQQKWFIQTNIKIVGSSNGAWRLRMSVIRECFPVADHKHGYRKLHSTTTVLHAIPTHMSAEDWNRTFWVALDLSKAFHTPYCLRTLSTPPLKRWIVNYMCGYMCRTWNSELRSRISVERNRWFSKVRWYLQNCLIFLAFHAHQTALS